MSSTTINVLLDSTYILPSFGIKVEGLSTDHLIRLREAGIKGKVKFHCLSAVWVEVIGKVHRERERLAKGNISNIDAIIDLAVRSLLESGFYVWLTPTTNAVKLAFKLRSLGHKDNIDNLLYATSVTTNMLLLTMDEDLKDFLSKNNLKTDVIVNHEELLKTLGYPH